MGVGPAIPAYEKIGPIVRRQRDLATRLIAY
jgi:hypothetical protein